MTSPILKQRITRFILDSETQLYSKGEERQKKAYNKKGYSAWKDTVSHLFNTIYAM